MTVIKADWLARQINQTNVEGIFNTINHLIQSGQIPSGAMLPPVKELALALQVSTGTLSAVWKRLRNLEMVAGNGRQGIKVIKAPITSIPLRFASLNETNHESVVLDLTYTTPDPQLLPDLKLAMCQSVNVDNLNNHAPQAIIPALQAAITPSWPYDAQAFIALSNGYEAMSLLFKVIARPDLPVAVEIPTSLSMLAVLKQLNIKIIPVTCDADGPSLIQLKHALQLKPQAFIYQPRDHTPCGHSLKQKRLLQLNELFTDRSMLLVEFDLTADLAGGTPLSSGCYYPQQTIYIRSYLKSFGSDMTLAVLSGSHGIVKKIEDLRGTTIGWSSRLLQQALAWLVENPDSQKQLKRARKTYINRRNTLIRTLNKLGIKLPPQQGLLSLWIPVQSEEFALATLAEYGIQAVGGRFFGLDYPAFIRISTNVIPEDKVDYVAKAVFWALGRNNLIA